MAGKADLVDTIAERTGMPKTKVAMVYDELFELIGDALAKGKGDEKVAVPNFGTFLVAKREARKGRNPATGKPITIKASKTVRFKVSTNLKKKL
jgi:DNA-binding protein HU-beta